MESGCLICLMCTGRIDDADLSANAQYGSDAYASTAPLSDSGARLQHESQTSESNLRASSAFCPARDFSLVLHLAYSRVSTQVHL